MIVIIEPIRLDIVDVGRGLLQRVLYGVGSIHVRILHRLELESMGFNSWSRVSGMSFFRQAESPIRTHLKHK